MAIQYFPAERWSAIVELAAQEASIASLVTSGAYQQESVGAKRVVINKIGTPTIRTYTPGVANTTEDLTDTTVNLDLDQDKYFQFKAEDGQLAQSATSFWEPAATQGGRAIALSRDTYVFGTNTYSNADIPADNKIASVGSSRSITSANVYETILEMGEILDAQNVPSNERWLIVPPWFYSKFKLKRPEYFAMGNEEVLVNGAVTRIDGFNLVKSNSLSAVGTGDDEFQILAMSARAVASAITLDNFEVMRDTSFFGNVVRQHYLFGAEVVHPEEVVILSAEAGAEA